jgi:hypothetical protein
MIGKVLDRLPAKPVENHEAHAQQRSLRAAWAEGAAAFITLAGAGTSVFLAAHGHQVAADFTQIADFASVPFLAASRARSNVNAEIADNAPYRDPTSDKAFPEARRMAGSAVKDAAGTAVFTAGAVALEAYALKTGNPVIYGIATGGLLGAPAALIYQVTKILTWLNAGRVTANVLDVEQEKGDPEKAPHKPPGILRRAANVVVLGTAAGVAALIPSAAFSNSAVPNYGAVPSGDFVAVQPAGTTDVSGLVFLTHQPQVQVTGSNVATYGADGPQEFAPHQLGKGNCFLVSPLASAAEAQPGLLVQHAQEQADGSYKVTIYRVAGLSVADFANKLSAASGPGVQGMIADLEGYLGISAGVAPVTVTVTPQQLADAQTRGIIGSTDGTQDQQEGPPWPLIYATAYNEAMGGNWENTSHGGIPASPIAVLTGHPSQDIPMPGTNFLAPIKIKIFPSWTPGYAQDRVFNDVAYANQHHWIVVAETLGTELTQKLQGQIPGHAEAVINAIRYGSTILDGKTHNGQDYIIIQQPWRSGVTDEFNAALNGHYSAMFPKGFIDELQTLYPGQLGEQGGVFAIPVSQFVQHYADLQIEVVHAPASALGDYKNPASISTAQFSTSRASTSTTQGNAKPANTSTPQVNWSKLGA